MFPLLKLLLTFSVLALILLRWRCFFFSLPGGFDTAHAAARFELSTGAFKFDCQWKLILLVDVLRLLNWIVQGL